MSLEENRVLTFLQSRKLMLGEDCVHIDSFTTDVIDGLVPQLERGKLTLVQAVPVEEQQVVAH